MVYEGVAQGRYSHTEGLGCCTLETAIGAHSEGGATRANAIGSHVEGLGTQSGELADYSHAEGHLSQSIGEFSHSEGRETKASGKYSHSEGFNTDATALASHSEGYSNNVTDGSDYSHAEGYMNTVYAESSHAEGTRNVVTASAKFAHVEGVANVSAGIGSHSEGGPVDVEAITGGCTAAGIYSHAEGQCTNAIGVGSHAEGKNSTANGTNSHAEGNYTTASEDYSHAEGQFTNAIGVGSHAEGKNSTANGTNSHAEGYDTTASGDYSHAEGQCTNTIGVGSHAEGKNSTANGTNSHAEGNDTTASGDYSHAEGEGTEASGTISHVEGFDTVATKFGSHAEGSHTKSCDPFLHASGMYNDNTGYAFDLNLYDDGDRLWSLFNIGAGSSEETRMNAVDVKRVGTVYLNENQSLLRHTYEVNDAHPLSNIAPLCPDQVMNSFKLSGITRYGGNCKVNIFTNTENGATHKYAVLSYPAMANVIIIDSQALLSLVEPTIDGGYSMIPIVGLDPISYSANEPSGNGIIARNAATEDIDNFSTIRIFVTADAITIYGIHRVKIGGCSISLRRCFNSTTGKWEYVDRTTVSPSNPQNDVMILKFATWGRERQNGSILIKHWEIQVGTFLDFMVYNKELFIQNYNIN
ncbi:MAG: hypothetical protein WCR34_00130 [Bacilli bacterium]